MKYCNRFRRRPQGAVIRVLSMVLVWLIGFSAAGGKPPRTGPEPLMLVIMDPLAKELACACVKGYGQRDYRKLAARLEAALKQQVKVEFSDDLRETITQIHSRELIVAGEQALVEQGLKRAELECHPVCELTGLDGET